MIPNGTRIGGLLIEGLLGRGAMGEVYLATQVSLKRPVAVKRIAEHLANDVDNVARFEREAQCIARIQAPNVVGVYEFGQYADGGGNAHYLLVMELVEGGASLKKYMTEPLDWRLASSVALQAAEGLAAAAEQGVVHRDIKPDNIMMTKKGVAKLTDFGLAKAVDSTSMTMGGTLLGTPSYMPPEACRGEPTDFRGDLYSLGATWFHMLAGRTPFKAENTMAMLRAHLDEPVPDIALLNPSVPEPIAALVRRCLAKRPDDRPASAQQLANELIALVGQGLHIPHTVPELVGHAHGTGPDHTTIATLVSTGSPADPGATSATRHGVGEAVTGVDRTARTMVPATATATGQGTRAQAATIHEPQPAAPLAATMVAPPGATGAPAARPAAKRAPVGLILVILIGAVIGLLVVVLSRNHHGTTAGTVAADPAPAGNPGAAAQTPGSAGAIASATAATTAAAPAPAPAMVPGAPAHAPDAVATTPTTTPVVAVGPAPAPVHGDGSAPTTANLPIAAGTPSTPSTPPVEPTAAVPVPPVPAATPAVTPPVAPPVTAVVPPVAPPVPDVVPQPTPPVVADPPAPATVVAATPTLTPPPAAAPTPPAAPVVVLPRAPVLVSAPPVDKPLGPALKPLDAIAEFRQALRRKQPGLAEAVLSSIPADTEGYKDMVRNLGALRSAQNSAWARLKAAVTDTRCSDLLMAVDAAAPYPDLAVPLGQARTYLAGVETAWGNGLGVARAAIDAGDLARAKAVLAEIPSDPAVIMPDIQNARADLVKAIAAKSATK
jgi:serine/threonine-protein kinase